MARLRRLTAGVAVTITISAAAVALEPGGPANAAPPAYDKTASNPALGNGLGRLVPGASARARLAPAPVRVEQEKLAIKDAQGRVLVDITPQADVSPAAFRRAATAAGLQVRVTDTATHTLEGYVAPEDITALAAVDGTGTLKLVPKPKVATGSVTSQGVAFQGIDKVLKAGVTGKGITVGVLSDSYDTATTSAAGGPLTIHAKQDIASGDLPGPGNAKYPTPVTVLQDFPSASATDEGRAMLQIIHDVAPAAKLCFATAFAGELQFADNIRRLADPKGACKADVIVDDVFYFDEPFFSDGPVAQAVDAVAAQGVKYFSSAGNQGDPGAWTSPVRLLPAKTAVKGTNLDLSTVPPALVDGGLQDMNPGAGTDVAQSVTLGDSVTLSLGWDDPLDVNGATYGDPYFTASGSLTTPTDVKTYSFTPTSAQLGKLVQVIADGVPTSSVDLVLQVTKPDGTVIGPIDTGSSPELASLTLDQPGAYTIAVSGFDGATGPFTVDVKPLLAPSKVTTDFNVLFFTASGKFVTSTTTDNRLSGLPGEVLALGGPAKLQLVIAKSGTAATPVKRLKYVANGDLYQDEYFDPLAPATFGHSAAKGAESVAAVDPFKPFLPEYFTSPGGKLPYYFDAAGNRLRTPELRQKPDVAATDGGNTTFFVSDSALDTDTLPNFFGTSAAAPHAAAIAALLLQKSGGGRSLSPAQVRTKLQKAAFTHDLDPNHAEGTAKGLTVSADGPQLNEADPVPGSMTDTRFFKVNYTGNVPLRSITFYGETASPSALGTTGRSDGIVFDPRPFTGTSPFRTQGFPFTVGDTTGVQKGRISASYGVPFGTTGTFRHLTIDLANGGLRKGAGFTFGVDRDLAVPGPGLLPREGNGADELGGSALPPSRFLIKDGLTFRATRADGTVIEGTLKNDLGNGFSPLDGYGLIDANRAVLG